MAAFSSDKTKLLHSCGLIAFVLLLQLNMSRSQKVTAMYVFGDSQVDVGNNDYFQTIFRANFPFNGIDYPGGKPTGRFSNGKNAADFLAFMNLLDFYVTAENVGLPTPPPYLSNKDGLFMEGVNFASGGAGILNTTNGTPFNGTIQLSKQIEYFSELQQRLIQKIGYDAAQIHLSTCLFPIVIGSNDLLNYFTFKLPMTKPPQQYIDLMLSTFSTQLRQLQGLGARKFLIFGLAPIGCTPAQRLVNISEGYKCNDEANYWARVYNQGLQSMLRKLKSQLQEHFNYSYLNTYDFLVNLVQNPTKYGFREVKAACCGTGRLNADVPCLPISTYCPNRNDHVFWDRVHPTEAVAKILINTLFNNTKQYM
ncbi:PREDICTED: GDSL esterase/lipase At5g55050-like [Nicotiana attenuata]|uniref:GDSL esterase/lipase At5g55050-like n=1 Tax=Nicotiana attenuata TaxID=49451 RepID=UPI0009056E72|nr:PREDICTED: GDSL esterase/lipase At5g55050-like [Nicotiana attenuata]